jgi:probable HAF family extracellular repeat protein
MVSLGVLSGVSSTATAVSNTGQVVGHSTIAGGAIRAFSWTMSGGMINLGTLNGWNSYARGVNDAGQVAGYVQAAMDGNPRAFVWSQGSGMVDLGAPVPNWALWGNDISNAGQVVGESSFSTGSHAYVWTAGQGFIDLGAAPGGSISVARRINAASQMVGNSRVAGLEHATIWRPSLTGAVPGAPTLRGSVNGTSVSVSWTASSSGGTPASYIVEAGTALASTNLFNRNVGNVTSAAATLPSGTYYIRVRGVNAAGTGAASSPDLILSVGCPALLPPTGLTHSKVGNRVSLSWSPSVGATSYVLQAGLSPGLSNAFNANVGLTTALNASAPPGTYFVRVIAVGACGSSAPTSPDLTITIP